MFLLYAEEVAPQCIAKWCYFHYTNTVLFASSGVGKGRVWSTKWTIFNLPGSSAHHAMLEMRLRFNWLNVAVPLRSVQLLLNLNWKHWPWGHISDQTYEGSGQPIIYKYCIIIIFIILYDGTLRYRSRPSVVPVTVSITAMCWLELETKAIRRFVKVSIVS